MLIFPNGIITTKEAFLRGISVREEMEEMFPFLNDTFCTFSKLSEKICSARLNSEKQINILIVDLSEESVLKYFYLHGDSCANYLSSRIVLFTGDRKLGLCYTSWVINATDGKIVHSIQEGEEFYFRLGDDEDITREFFLEKYRETTGKTYSFEKIRLPASFENTGDSDIDSQLHDYFDFETVDPTITGIAMIDIPIETA